MPDLVYLIGNNAPLRFSPYVSHQFTMDRIPFSKAEEILRREGNSLPTTVGHMLVDGKYSAEELRRLDRLFSPLPRDDPDRGHPLRYIDFRYRTVVVSGRGTMGNVLGYSARADRKKQLSKSVRAYTARGKYEYLRGDEFRDFRPPYFALTSLESIDEVKEAFEELGIEVKLVDRIVKEQNLIVSVNNLQVQKEEAP